MDADAPLPPSMANASPALQQAWRQLRRDYADQLPAKLAHAAALLGDCQRAPDDDGALEALHRALHTLAGSAGTFGWNALGERARAAEHLLDALGPRHPRSRSDFDPVAALVDGLPGDGEAGR
jgi:chemotaxis protein histidine kinase CheA